ncbi:hypothetical protein [Candidatus Lokiarchaeum ossiferum]|uniref:hypothetical protein n=1 Tax=Candidatus Lokiarchaeum ossiferum TaxID=2951803 RepID=UPI00352DE71F
MSSQIQQYPFPTSQNFDGLGLTKDQIAEMTKYFRRVTKEDAQKYWQKYTIYYLVLEKNCVVDAEIDNPKVFDEVEYFYAV